MKILTNVSFIVAGDKIEISEQLREFFRRDNMGIEGLQFMLKHPQLAAKVPEEVQKEYESIYASIKAELERNITEAEENLRKIRMDSKDMINKIIEEGIK